MEPAPRIVGHIIGLSLSKPAVLVSIDGLGGAGKTTLAAAVYSDLKHLGMKVDVIHFDDFYLPTELRLNSKGSEAPIGGNFDWKRLRDEVLVPLHLGHSAKYVRYDWESDSLAELHEVPASGIVIVEGVGSSRRELAELYDLRVWVDCSREQRLRRGIARDGEGSRDVWENDWMPGEDRYLAEHRPNLIADFVVSGEAE